MDAIARDTLITEIVSEHITLELNTKPLQNTTLRWLIDSDNYYICPDEDNQSAVLQRYVAAMVALSLKPGYKLISKHECGWHGFECNLQQEIKEIRFDEAQGNLPEEVSVLPKLQHLVSQRGNMTDIHLNIQELGNLKHLDFDKNNIHGTFPNSGNVEMTSMERIDINYNSFSGGLEFLNSYPNLKEAHLDNNAFNGTIPESLGELSNLRILTLQNNSLTGTMPSSICDLRENGKLSVLIADCGGFEPKVNCTCCTHCFPFTLN